MLKILQARTQQYVNWELPDVQVGLEKPEEPDIKLPTSIGSQKNQENSRKSIYLCFTDYAKAFDCVDHNKVWKRWEYQTTLPASWETCMQAKKQQLEQDMEQQTGSK